MVGAPNISPTPAHARIELINFSYLLIGISSTINAYKHSSNDLNSIHELRPDSTTLSILVVPSLLLLLVFSGCARSEKRADVVIVNGAELESIDPHVLTGQADGRVALALFEGLTRYNPTNATPDPGLAQRWEISNDGLRYTFHLRPGIRWSNGEPITTEDFVYSWRRALDPVSVCENAGLLYYIKNAVEFNRQKLTDFSKVGIRARDATTLEVELENPTAFFLDLTAYVPYVVVPRKTIEKYGDRWLMTKPFVASGAFTLEFWRLNDKIRVRKNPLYWDAANTRSEIIDLLPCTVPATALNLYDSGAADIVWDKELVPSELIDVLIKRPDFHTYNYQGIYFYRYNVNRKPFDDPRVRRAFALVVNKKWIVDRITRAGEPVAESMTPPGTANGSTTYNPSRGLAHDPELARKLLAEAGFPGGKNFPAFDFYFNTQRINEKIALELREMWRKELGITAGLKQMEWKTYLRAQSQLEYDLSKSSWVADYNDPNTFLDLFMSDNPNNRTGWTNGAYDQLILKANREPDTARRQEMLQKAEDLLVKEEVPVVPLYFYVGLEYYNGNRITGVFPNLKAEHPLRAIGPVPNRRR